jgi:hypothetical protein
MKAVIIGISLLILSGCVTSNRMLAVKDKNLIDIRQEEGEEYELLVLDPGFETWFITTWSPAKDRSPAYYKMWNQRYVNAWNFNATRPHKHRFFDNMIQYDAMADYGMDVERKLYYYFRWVDTQLRIPILDTPPPGGIL